MKKVAIIFLLAVLAPSLLLAWLAIRSLRVQEFSLHRHRTLLYEGVADAAAKDILAHIETRRAEWNRLVEKLTHGMSPRDAAEHFDPQLRERWPLAQVGFVVTLDGEILAPSLFASSAARQFRLDHDRFLSGRESVDVHWDTPKWTASGSPTQIEAPPSLNAHHSTTNCVTAGRAGLDEVIADDSDGVIGRFLQDRLTLLFWRRAEGAPNVLFGAQVDMDRLVQGLGSLVRVEPALANEVVLALLDDQDRMVSTSRDGFRPAARRPILSRDLAGMLPHWRVAVYPINPAELSQSATNLRWILSSIIAFLVLAIAIGGWLIVLDLRRQLTLARQKTDFVSNVSHELKTPLTSIRMFAELLLADSQASGCRESDRAGGRHPNDFLAIIIAETARLTRLINNVLDFARLDRGDAHYKLCLADLRSIVRETCDAFALHLEPSGIRLHCHTTDGPMAARVDPDAIAQILLNLLSNAEKYGGSGHEIEVRADFSSPPSRINGSAAITVSDRGPGVPPGSESKIFDQFYRAHDSLNSGIPGSGLGLTLARQIARAHGGDVTYARRPGGGSIFTLHLPLAGPPVGTPPTEPLNDHGPSSPAPTLRD